MCGDASRALVSSLSRQMEVAGLDKGTGTRVVLRLKSLVCLLTTLTNI